MYGSAASPFGVGGLEFDLDGPGLSVGVPSDVLMGSSRPYMAVSSWPEPLGSLSRHVEQAARRQNPRAGESTLDHVFDSSSSSEDGERASRRGREQRDSKGSRCMGLKHPQVVACPGSGRPDRGKGRGFCSRGRHGNVQLEHCIPSRRQQRHSQRDDDGVWHTPTATQTAGRWPARQP